MSLLMDALRKAEKSRQAEAARTQKEEDPSATGGFSLDPLDTPLEVPTDSSPEVARASAGIPTPEVKSEDSMNLDFDDGALSGTGSSEDSVVEQYPDDMLSPLSLVDEHALSDDTSASMPSRKEPQASVDSYFDGTHSISMSMEQVRSAVGLHRSDFGANGVRRQGPPPPRRGGKDGSLRSVLSDSARRHWRWRLLVLARRHVNTHAGTPYRQSRAGSSCCSTRAHGRNSGSSGAGCCDCGYPR